MEIIGVIAEYNPFHNGHLYHLKQIKKLYKDSLLVAVITGYFTQRGNLSLINKQDKTKLALDYGIDLVLELPFAYTIQSADTFAYAALKILNAVGVTKIIFGSESNDLNILTKIAQASLDNNQINKKIKPYLKSGLNYPTALSKVIYDMTSCKIDTPNDLLGISYIKEIIKNNYNIIPITIKRTNNYNDKTPNKTSIISATAIREMLKNSQDITSYIPKYNFNVTFYNIEIFNYLKYKIIIDEKNLSKYLSFDETLLKKLKKAINQASTCEELINLLKTKKDTYNKISRMLLYILTSFTKEEKESIEIDYIRVLGMNKKGQNYLKQIKNKTSIPIITKYKDINSKLLDLEYRSVLLFSTFTNDQNLAKLELQKPVIKD